MCWAVGLKRGAGGRRRKDEMAIEAGGTRVRPALKDELVVDQTHVQWAR